MTPGCYPNISLAAYHAAPGLSKSDLDLIARSPAHWKYGERVTTPSMRLGAAVHAAVLEPDQWERRYARAIGRREADLDAAPNPTVLSAAEWETCQRIREAVWRHPPCRDLFRDGQAEYSAWWLDPETGLLCKCRPVTPGGTLPHHDTIAASVVNSGAHRDWQKQRTTVQVLVGRGS